MRAFKAVVKLTLQNALRSHIFQLLLIVLAVCAIGMPLSVAGDGTAGGYIQIALMYSFAGVSAILALSSLWVSCFIMTQDIDSYQLHMVVTKPISRIKLWLAKFTGVLLMHLVLLLLASIAIYISVIWQFSRQDFTPEDKEKINSEVLVGRRVFNFNPPDIEKVSRELLEQRLKKAQSQGMTFNNFTNKNEEELLQEMRRIAISDTSQVSHNLVKEWVFENLPVDPQDRQPLFLRYRVYVGKVDTKDQRETSGIWYIGVPRFEVDSAGKIIDEKKYQIFYYQFPEQSSRSGEFQEMKLPKELVTPDGKVFLAYRNTDPEKAVQFFQPTDGPKVLMKVSGFFENYFRAVVVLMLELVILTALGCAFASVLSLPTAIFLSIAYLFFGAFATYMAESAAETDKWIKIFSDILLFLIIPLQKFGVSEMVAKGELIELAHMGGLFLNYFVFRTLPIVIIGVWIYNKREIGLVVRK